LYICLITPTPSKLFPEGSYFQTKILQGSKVHFAGFTYFENPKRQKTLLQVMKDAFGAKGIKNLSLFKIGLFSLPSD
jgi:hypothetical protein